MSSLFNREKQYPISSGAEKRRGKGSAQTLTLAFLLFVCLAVGLAYTFSNGASPTGLVTGSQHGGWQFEGPEANLTEQQNSSPSDVWQPVTGDHTVEPPVNTTPARDLEPNGTGVEPEPNQTEPSVPPEEQGNGTPGKPDEKPKPFVNVQIQMPLKATRGETITVKAIATSNGARNVMLSWKLAPGFEIISGEMQKYCGDLQEGNCISEIELSTSMSTELGESEISVEASYE